MVTTSEIENAVAVLRRFGARRVVLFGSAVSDPTHANDIDLGCEGIPAVQFYRAVGTLMRELRRDVDVIDFDDDPMMAEFILKHGKVLYAA